MKKVSPYRGWLRLCARWSILQKLGRKSRLPILERIWRLLERLAAHGFGYTKAIKEEQC